MEINTEMNFEDIEATIKSRFPGFVIHDDIEGIPTVVFSFLADYLVSVLIENNSLVIKEFIEFINQMAEKKDSLSITCLSEFFLSFNESRKINPSIFVNQLSDRSKATFNETIDTFENGKRVQ